MFSGLYDLFTDCGLRRFEVDHDWISECYASQDQLFVVTDFIDSRDLNARWSSVARLVATEIQGQMKDTLDSMRWDIYLLLCVDGAVDHMARTVIETNRSYFRKIVLTPEDCPYDEKVPVSTGEPFTANPSFVDGFDERTFVQELMYCVDEPARELLSTVVTNGGINDKKWDEFAEKWLRTVSEGTA